MSIKYNFTIFFSPTVIKAGYACEETEDLCFTGAYCDTLKKCKCAKDYTLDDDDCGKHLFCDEL